MYYKEYLRARRTLVIFSIVAAVLLAVSLASMAITVGGDRSSSQGIPWPELLEVAALAAAVMATILGSTLSQENDGHLELALTKPSSRAQYAATTIAVDMAAVVLAMLLGFAFIVIHIVIVHPYEHIVAGPDAAINALRFTLFPLAWYAIIAGLSAGMRCKTGNIVQMLIWPIAFVLVALREAPFNAAWHGLFVALNAVNPLIYISYHNHGDMTIAAASSLHVAANAAMLAALTAAGWVAATLQWRRVEA